MIRTVEKVLDETASDHAPGEPGFRISNVRKYIQNIFIFVKQELCLKTDHAMSHHCPLCGKEKKEEALFCDACSNKLRAEYEVVLPESLQPHPTGGTNRRSDKEIDPLTEPVSSLQDSNEMPTNEKTGSSADELKGSFPDANTGEAVKRSSSRKAGRRLVRIAVILLLLMIAFLLYNELIRKGNLERSGWDTAIKANSVTGYLHYIENHPDGAHFEEAQAALMRLKADEADRWEVMRHSELVTELRDFLLQFPESNYAPLVKRRLDSLTWMGALHSNTSSAYSDYMMMAESGDFNGDYLAEAETRYRMLFQSYPVEQSTLDSVRIVVNGFCSALSSLDHAGLEQWFAPRVERYYFSGPLSRERLLGELLIGAARSEEPAITYIPDLEEVQLEKTLEDRYRINLPLLKSLGGTGTREQLPGYILHLELNPLFQITAVHETKPYPGAP